MKNIYTDWSCTNFYNFRTKKMDWDKSWWIWVVIFEDWEFIKWISESYSNTTNQKMELLAIIRALQYSEWDVTVYSDSQYSLNCSWKWINSENWKEYLWWKYWWLKDWSMFWKWKELKNLKYIQEINKLCNWRDIKFIWIRWHTWIYWNELADKLSCKRENIKLCEFE